MAEIPFPEDTTESGKFQRSVSGISLLTTLESTESWPSHSDVSDSFRSFSADNSPETPDSGFDRPFTPVEFWKTQIVSPSSCLSAHLSTSKSDNSQQLDGDVSAQSVSHGLRVQQDHIHATHFAAALSLVSMATTATDEAGLAVFIGHSSEVLPLCVVRNPNTTIHELLEGIEATLTSTVSYRHSPPRKPGHPQFDVVLDLSRLLKTPEQKHCTMLEANLDQHAHVILEMCHQNNGATAELEARFNPSHVSRESIVALLWQLDEMLYQLATQPPDLKIKTVACLDHKDLVRIRAWKAAETESLPHHPSTCIHDTVTAWAKATPNAEAIDGWDVRLRFSELDTVSSSLAYHLVLRYGVGQGDIVPLYMDRSGLAIVCMLAVAKTGAAFVPLDPANPRGRNEDIVETCRAKRILVQPGLPDPSPLCADKAESTIISWEVVNNLPPPLPADLAQVLPAVQPNSLAYIIFTSGSTGRPKGVMVEHANLRQSLSAHGGDILGQGPKSRVLQFASPAFDASMSEHLAPLSNGGCVCIPDAESRMADLAGYITTHAVNWCFLTPSFAKLLKPENVPSLRTVVLGGEAITNDCIDQWAARTRLINGYGPTENTIAATACVVEPNSANRASIGRGITCRTWVVDVKDHTRLVPVGMPGELVLQGPSVARGYLNDEEKTKAAFVDVPWWGQDPGLGGGGRVYKTGDLVRYLDDGSLYYLGRKDTQVKVRGQRLELSEVEHNIPMDKIRHAAAFVPKAGVYAGALVVVMASMSAPVAAGEGGVRLLEGEEARWAHDAAQEARATLSTILPGFAVPDIWLPIDTMPLNTSTKTDRQILIRWLESFETRGEVLTAVANGSPEPDDDAGGSPEESKTESIIRGAWAHVLSLPRSRVALDCSFQSLGGDSIRAVQVLGRCRSHNIRFTVRRILQGASIRELAFEAEDHAVTAHLSDDVMASSEPLNVPFPLSPVQRIYAHHMPKTPHYFNQTCVVRLRGVFEQNKVESAVSGLVGAHSMLRARLVETGHETGRPVFQQIVTKDAEHSFLFNHHAVSSLQDAQAIVQTSQHQVDIKAGPVLVANMIQVGGEETLLSLIVSHFSIDIVSWTVLLDDFDRLMCTGQPPLVSMPFQTWTRQQASEPAWSRQATLPYSVPSVDFLEMWSVGPDENTYGDARRREFSVPVAVLLDRCRVTSLSGLDIFLASLFLAFSNSFPERNLSDFAIFTEGHGREPWKSNQDVSRTVGWFTAATPVVLQGAAPKGSDSLWHTAYCIHHVRNQVLGGGLPFQESRDGSEPMEVVFNYMGQQQRSEDAADSEDSALNSSFDVLSEFRGDGGDHASENMNRFSIFEISADVNHHGEARFVFSWPKTAKHQDRIHEWIDQTSQVLLEAARSLGGISGMDASLSVPPSCDLSQMPPDYDQSLALLRHAQSRVQQTHLGSTRVLSMCPTSHIQRAMLQAQKIGLHPGAYRARLLLLVQSSGDEAELDPERLIRAWKRVVARHEILRTVFVARPESNLVEFDQVVLEHAEPRARHVVLDFDLPVSQEERVDLLPLLPSLLPELDEHEAQHTFTVFTSHEGKTGTRATDLVVFECSHAIIDHLSLQILLRDLNEFYYSEPNAAARIEAQAPQYIDLISPSLRPSPQSIAEGTSFWGNLFGNMGPQQAPPVGHLSPLSLARPSNGARGCYKKLPVPLPTTLPSALQSLCHQENQHQARNSASITPALICRFCWALLLARRLHTKAVSFGYVVAGRDQVEYDGIDEVVGPCLNIVGCVARFDSGSGSAAKGKGATARDCLGELASQFLDSLAHQQTFLDFASRSVSSRTAAGVGQGSWQAPTAALFDTLVNFRSHTTEGDNELKQHGEMGEKRLAFEQLEEIDPFDHAAVVEIDHHVSGSIAVNLSFWHDAVEDGLAAELVSEYAEILARIVVPGMLDLEVVRLL